MVFAFVLPTGMNCSDLTRRTVLQSLGVSTLTPLLHSVVASADGSYISYTTIQSNGVFAFYYDADADTLEYLDGARIELIQDTSTITADIQHREAELDELGYVLEAEVGEDRVSELIIHGEDGSHPLHDLPETVVHRENWFYLCVDEDSLSTADIPEMKPIQNGEIETRETECTHDTVDNTVWIEWDADDELKTLLEHSTVRLLRYEELDLLGYFQLRETAAEGLNRCPSIRHNTPYNGEEYFILLDTPNHQLALDKQLTLKNTNTSPRNIAEDFAIHRVYQPTRDDELAEHRVQTLEARRDDE